MLHFRQEVSCVKWTIFVVEAGMAGTFEDNRSGSSSVDQDSEVPTIVKCEFGRNYEKYRTNAVRQELSQNRKKSHIRLLPELPP